MGFRNFLAGLFILGGLLWVARGILTLGLGVDPVSLFFLEQDPSVENLLLVGATAFAKTMFAILFIVIGAILVGIGAILRTD